MTSKTLEENTIFKTALSIFNQKTKLFLNLLIFFAPLILIVQFSGVLLNPYIKEAESYGRIGGRALLLSMGFMWLKALLEDKDKIAPLRNINLDLIAYLFICLLFCFGPFWAIAVFEWGLSNISAQLVASLDLLLWALEFGALYIAVRSLFLLPEYIQTQKISPLKSFHMTKPVYLDVLWDYIRYAMPFAIFIFVYPLLMHVVFGIINFRVPTEEQPIFHYIMFSPISLFIHPLLLMTGLTAVYAAYVQSTSTEAGKD